MKASIAVSAFAGLATAAYAPFSVDYMTTHKPNSNPDGDVNYYSIQFNVSSTNGGTTQSGFCWSSWGDNANNFFCTEDNDCIAYSTGVPTGSWIQCAHNSSKAEDQTSEFAFQLYPYFRISNFSVALQQTFTQKSAGTSSQIIVESNPYNITNTTSAYTCTFEATEDQQQASGDCSTPAGSAGFRIPVASSFVKPACAAKSVTLSFPVREKTAQGDYVFVVGNITQLGNWNPDKAVALNANSYTAANTLWTGGQVSVPAGTPFEFKYIVWLANGTLLWETGNNRVGAASKKSCGAQTIGDNPNHFGGNNH